jgi:hypothetical protein
MLKDVKRSLCGDIGLVLLSGLGSRRTHPHGAEGAISTKLLPTYIEHSMKLLCVCLCPCLCLNVSLLGGFLPHLNVFPISMIYVDCD